ncbi:hypothetical protein [Halorussus litoreus]|uniref:hypothetical protein n=1 Tax=Halorussus litoreus TaxID=1710536 RepID=UPI0018E4F79B|nr:hypothetical protein [Halorussus litoreus]
MTPSEFIERVFAAANSDSVSDEAVSNLFIEAEATTLSEETFIELLEAWDAFPSYFSGFRLIADDQRLFELSGRELRANDEGLTALAEREIEPSVDVQHHRGGFDRYYPDNISETARVLYQFATELDNAGITVTIGFGLQKKRIASDLLTEETPDPVSSDLNPILWWTPTELFQWIGTREPDEVATELFDYDSAPIFLFFQGAPDSLSPIPMWTATDVDTLPREDIEQAIDQYLDSMTSSRKYTHWRGDLSPIHPCLVEGLWDECTGEEVDTLYVYALLGVLSAAVDRNSPHIQFHFSNEPEFAPKIDLEEQCAVWGEDGIRAIQDLYQSFQGEEEKDAFRDLWQLAITEQCRGTERGIEILPEVIEDIKSSYQDLQVSAVEENFEALSDVLEDTQTLMAGLTDRLSSAANETSQDIQRLTFTLLGAIVANIFLVLRWSDRSLVPPFSLFVLIVIVGFYLPLIQGRIEDLDNTITEVKNDYEFYEKHIRRFNKDLFQFGDLEDRKSAYVTLAKKQRKRAQTQLQRVFYALLTVWSGLAIWSGIAYPFGQSQSLALAVSGVVLGILFFGPTEGPFGHRGYEYFSNRAATATIVIIVLSFLLPLFTPFLTI